MSQVTCRNQNGDMIIYKCGPACTLPHLHFFSLLHKYKYNNKKNNSQKYKNYIKKITLFNHYLKIPKTLLVKKKKLQKPICLSSSSSTEERERTGEREKACLQPCIHICVYVNIQKVRDREKRLGIGNGVREDREGAGKLNLLLLSLKYNIFSGFQSSFVFSLYFSVLSSLLHSSLMFFFVPLLVSSLKLGFQQPFYVTVSFHLLLPLIFLGFPLLKNFWQKEINFFCFSVFFFFFAVQLQKISSFFLINSIKDFCFYQKKLVSSIELRKYQ